jgi:hypothetical protein
LSQNPVLFFFSYFLNRVLCFSQGSALSHNPPTYPSPVAGIADTHHNTWLIGWDGGLSSFFSLAGLKQQSCNVYLSNSWRVYIFNKFPDDIDAANLMIILQETAVTEDYIEC